ncbi:hypothetical protein BH20PSE1_BH20PSE1_20110 [soil metagenome]
MPSSYAVGDHFEQFIKQLYSANTFCTVLMLTMMPQPGRVFAIPGHDGGVRCCTRGANR